MVCKMPDGGGGEVLRRCMGFDSGNSGASHGGRDMRQHVQIAESSSFGNKRPSSELYMQKPSPPSIRTENNGRRNYLTEVGTVLSLPKQDDKTSIKKSVKMLSSLPCSKRPKVEQTANPAGPEAKGSEVLSQKIGADLIQSTLSESSRLVKHKRGNDSRRTDKKNLRSGLRAKYDCFTSMAASNSYDSSFVGSNVLGTHGLKYDIRHVAKYTEELSLNELLDGSYKYPVIAREKGKKACHTKEELVVCVNKACSILSLALLDSSKNGKDAAMALSPKDPSEKMDSGDDREKSIGKSQTNIEDPALDKSSNATLCHPKVILDQLALPQDQDLDSLLSASSVGTSGLQPVMHSTLYHGGASLPPFPWSNTQSGVFRPNFDSGKLATTRNSSQGQWIRLGSNFTCEGEGSSIRHKIDNLLQELENSKEVMRDPEPVKDPCNKQLQTCCMQSTRGLLVPCSSKKVMGENDPQLPSSVGHRDSECALGKPEETAHSPKVLRAAEILCEMRCSDASITQGYSNGTIKWPNSTSEKTMKGRKPSSSLGKPENPLGARHDDVIRTTANQPAKAKFIDTKNDFSRSNNHGKGPIRWPVPVDGGGASSPSRPEKGLMLNTRQPTNNVARYSNHLSTQARLEKEYEHQQKLRKASLASSLGIGGGPSGDWNRAKNRKL